MTLVMVALFASTATAATVSTRTPNAGCSARAVGRSTGARCGAFSRHAAVLGTGAIAAELPTGLIHDAISVSVAATGFYPYELICSVVCSDGAAGTFSAHHAPGTMVGYLPPVDGEVAISGSVFCLDVFGRNAIVGGLIQASNFPPAIGRSYFVVISDRGYPGAARDILAGAVVPGSCTLGFGRFTPLGVINDAWPKLEDGNFLLVR